MKSSMINTLGLKNDFINIIFDSTVKLIEKFFPDFKSSILF